VTRTACPLDCPDTCTLEVTVDAGRITSIDAGPGNPLTDGYICQKVKHHARRVYGPDRVLTPLMRTGPKGSGTFEPIAWDRALDLFVDRLLAAAAGPNGPASVVPYLYNSSAGDLALAALGPRLWRRFGATDVLPTICAATAGAAYDAVYGDMLSADPFDVVHARCVVVWGANPTVTNIHFPQLVQKARDTGARLIVVDPRRTAMAARADRHLALRPGTDVVLAYALADLMRRGGLLDERFLADHASGLDEFLDAAAAWPLERAADICGLAASDIAATAVDYATSRPAFLRMGWGLERNRNGGSSCRAVLSLPVLAGQFGVVGSGVMTSLSSGAPLSFRGADPDARIDWPARRIANMNTIGALLCGELAGPPVEVLFVQGANIAVMNPNQNAVLRGLEREDLYTVVHEQVMTDTARYADLVLPAPTHFEARDVKHSYGTYALMQVQPVIDRMGEGRTNDELAADIADRLGYPAPVFSADPELLIEAVTIDGGSTTEARTVREPGTTVQFRDTFPTFVDRKARLADRGNSERPVPTFTELASDFPLTLISPANHKTINSMFGEFQAPEAAIQLHPDDASARAISDGDRVRVWNAQGAIVVAAHVNRDLRPGVCALPKGVWLRDFDGGLGVNSLVPDSLSDLADGACFNDARVEVVSVV
jgi:anaerobic selenocysteine-containing dehydrogenase